MKRLSLGGLEPMPMSMVLILLLCSLYSSAVVAQPAAPSAEDRIRALEDRLNRMETAPAKTSLSAFNPAIGLSIDTVLRHSNDRANFEFRSAEMNLEAPIDPFLKGWAILNGSQDGVAVEEASLETTALPYNLTVRGGRLFAQFGRLEHFHDHELPVVDRPLSIDRFVGGEARGDGLEASVLLPLDTYVMLTLGAYNKLGAENDRVRDGNARPLDAFTYLARANTYKDIGDDHSLELGVDSAWTPKRYAADLGGLGVTTVKNTWRTLSGVDLTYRYHPSSGGIYKGLTWGTEVLQNVERRFDAATGLPTDRARAYGGFSYIQFKAGPHWQPTVMVDLAEDLDRPRELTKTFSGLLSYYFTEFHRVRLSYARQTLNVPGRRVNSTVAIQWSGIIGYHVHGYRDR